MAGTIKLAIQMDSLAAITPQSDTSFALALEAQKRGYEIFIYQPASLVSENGRLSAAGEKVRLADKPAPEHILAAEKQTADLAAFDVLLIRQDPPFDLAYLAATHMLAALAGEVLIINAPLAILQVAEKIFASRFAALTPPTLIACAYDAFAEFRERHGALVLKPLYGGGGADIFYIAPDDPNFPLLLDLLFARWQTPLLAQKFLPEIAQGDRRVILLEGEAVAALNRLPPAGGVRANLAAGGSGERQSLNERDLAIAAEIGPILRRLGITLAGIDIIGGKLTEINVTSPTGIRQIMAQKGPDLAALFWDAAEKRLAGQS